jgi:hypothetical protein
MWRDQERWTQVKQYPLQQIIRGVLINLRARRRNTVIRAKSAEALMIQVIRNAVIGTDNPSAFLPISGRSKPCVRTPGQEGK